MPGPKKINVSRAKKVSTAVRKSRVTTRSKTSMDGAISSEKEASAGGQKNVESDSDSDDKHSEAQPATDVTIYNEYDMGPAFGCKFPTQFIRYMIERVLTAQFKGKTYQPGDATKWVREVADNVNMKMQGYCRQHRFKHVVNVVIYQQTGAGFFYGFRAVWDLLSDDYIRYTFDAGSLMCIVSVFGCYQY